MRRTRWIGTRWIGTRWVGAWWIGTRWIGPLATMCVCASTTLAEEDLVQGPVITGLTEPERALIKQPVEAAWKHAVRWLESLELEGLEVVAPAITVHGWDPEGPENPAFPIRFLSRRGAGKGSQPWVEGLVDESMIHALRHEIGHYALDSVAADPPPRAIEEGFAEVFALSSHVARRESQRLTAVLDLLHVATCLADTSTRPDLTWRIEIYDRVLDRMDRVDDLRHYALGWSFVHMMCFREETSLLAATIRRFAADPPPEMSWRQEFKEDPDLVVVKWLAMLSDWRSLPWSVRAGDRRGWYGLGEESFYYRSPVLILPEEFKAAEYLPSPRLIHRDPQGIRRGTVSFGPISNGDPFRVVFYGGRTSIIPRLRIENDLERGVLRATSYFDWTVESQEWTVPTGQSGMTVELSIENGDDGEGDQAVWRVEEITIARFALEEWEGLKSLQIEQGGELEDLPIKIIDRT